MALEPEDIPLREQQTANLMPVAGGTVDGEDFMITMKSDGSALYVQFEGHGVKWDVDDLLDQSYEHCFGTSPGGFEFGGFDQ